MQDTFANFTLLTLKDQPIIKPQGLNVWNIQTVFQKYAKT